MILRQAPSLRNPLAYPAGRRAGFDPSHPAAAGILFSGIAAGGNFINLLSGTPGTLNGGASAPTSSIFGSIGPTVYSLNNGNVSFAYPNTAWASQTMACIVTFDSATSAAVRVILSTSAAATTGFLLIMNVGGANNTWSYNMGGTQVAFTSGQLASAIVANVPYFYAVSIQSGLPVNGVLRRLDNGQIASGTMANALSFTAGDTTLSIGNRGLNTRQTVGKIAAAMHANSYLSIPQLLQWAQDPWSFWFPRNLDLTQNIFGVSAAGGFIPAWAMNSNLPVLGTGTY